MSKSSDPGHFFQTETSLATAARRAAKASNKNGDPIQVTSKILAVLADPTDANRVYVAESCGIVRRISLETGNKHHIYRGHTVPTTCLALNSSGTKLFAGSWDKTVICWDTETKEQTHTFIGHTDFVKSLLFIPCPSKSSYPGGLLLSGSSDTCIVIWNAATGERLHVLKGHTRAVGTMACDPVASTSDTAIIYAGGSERDIRKWSIPLNDIKGAKEATDPILEHDTSVYKITFQGEDCDFWSASADFTARRIDIRDPGKKVGARTDTLLKHPDYVNDVLIEPLGIFVVTACRDEEVRLWKVSSGELYHSFEGHADEVSGLAIVGERGERLVSVGIDSTVRTWSLKAADLKAAKEAAVSGEVEEKKEESKNNRLTEEEERELAELIDDSD